VSLPAPVFLLILVLFAALWEYLLWWAFRRGNRAVLLHSSGLVVLMFAIILLIAFYILLVKPLLHVTWPWSWVINGLAWLLALLSLGPSLLVGFDLLWKGPQPLAAPPSRIDWKLLLLWSAALGCLLGVITGFHWFSSPVFFLVPDQRHSPVLFGAFWLDGFWQGFFWGVGYAAPAAYRPWLVWRVQTFSERRWFFLGTSLLVLGLILVAVLLWN
jgi:hypothetical protein